MAAILGARELAPGNPAALAVQAEIYAEQHRWVEAQGLIDQALLAAQEIRPINRSALARADYVRGNIEQILGHADKAIAAYEAAMRISTAKYDPADPWMVVPPGYILYQLGPMLMFQGKGDEALQRYSEALEVDKQDS